MKGHRKFLRGGGSYKPNFLKQSMKQNWNFRGGGGDREGGAKQKPIMGEYGNFLELHDVMLVNYTYESRQSDLSFEFEIVHRKSDFTTKLLEN